MYLAFACEICGCLLLIPGDRLSRSIIPGQNPWLVCKREDVYGAGACHAKSHWDNCQRAEIRLSPSIGYLKKSTPTSKPGLRGKMMLPPFGGKIFRRYPTEEKNRENGVSSWLAEASYGTMWLAKGRNMAGGGGGSLNFKWSGLFMLRFCCAKYSLLCRKV